MITNGFTYIAVLVFIAALLVWLQRYTKSKFFDYAPPIVLLYLITMILCTLGAWDMEATKPAYSVLKNNLLYAMLEGRVALHELAGPLELLGGQARDEHVALACGDERVYDAGDLLGRLALAVDDLARAAPGASREVELRIADVCHFGCGG